MNQLLLFLLLWVGGFVTGAFCYEMKNRADRKYLRDNYGSCKQCNEPLGTEFL